MLSSSLIFWNVVLLSLAVYVSSLYTRIRRLESIVCLLLYERDEHKIAVGIPVNI